MTELQTNTCPDIADPMQNFASAMHEAQKGARKAISAVRRFRQLAFGKPQVVWFVANKFLTNSKDDHIRKLRRSGFQRYGKFAVLIDAWQCAKQHPDACITRCVIDRDDVTFEHWYGREMLALYFEGKYKP